MKSERIRIKRLWPLVALAALLLILLAQPALAVDKQWVGPNPNNLWTNPNNWSPPGEPGSDDVFLTIGAGSQTVLYNINLLVPLLNSLTIDATGGGTITLLQLGKDLSISSGGTETVGSNGKGIHTQIGGNTVLVNAFLILGQNTGSSGTYNLNNGNLSLDADSNEYIGLSGTGRFTQIGGTHTIGNELFIGENSTGSGTYQLIGGSFSSGFEIIGDNGTGSFTQIGGTHSINDNLILGGGGGSGSYNLIGGSLSGLTLLEIIGNDGTGTFAQSGGTHTVSELDLGTSVNSWGSYKLLGGSLQANLETIGDAGTGSFTHTSGIHTVNGNLSLGNSSIGVGTYNLKSGRLSVGMDEIIGDEGTGSFIQNSGNHSVNGNLTLGKAITGSGTYNLISGNLTVGGDEIIGNEGTGSFNHTSGNHTVNGDLTLGLGTNLSSGSGTYNLQGGTLQAAKESIGPGPFTIGIFNQTGGLNRVTNGLTLGDFPISDEHTAYNLTGGILTAKNIEIFAGASFNVKNVVTTVTGDVINQGDVRTTNAIVTWNGNFINDELRYTSNSSKQTFNKDLDVNAGGVIIATHSQDLFVIKNNFVNQSNQNFDWNTVQATLKFATGADNNHDFYIPGADNGPPGHVPITAVTDNFAWGTLNIAGQVVHLFDANDTPGGAQYVGALIGADVSGIAVNNIVSAPNSLVNIYYDPDLALNFYLGGLTYDLAGGNGQLIPFHTPLPPSVLLLGSGLLGLGLLGWRRKRLMS